MADYRNVDPRIGTLDDFDEMVAALKAVDIKVIVDIVPNHASEDHEWFQAALKAGKGSKERERFIFRNGKSNSVVWPMQPGLILRPRTEQGPASLGLAVQLWRSGMDESGRRTVVPAHVRQEPAGLELV